MLVYLHRYRDPDADAAAESDGEVADTDPEEYFGKEGLAPETDDDPEPAEGAEVGPTVDDSEAGGEGASEPGEWERIEYGDRTLLRRPETYEGVTELSVPRDAEEPGDGPGETVQLLIDGENRFVERAVVVEVTDENP